MALLVKNTKHSQIWCLTMLIFPQSLFSVDVFTAEFLKIVLLPPLLFLPVSTYSVIFSSYQFAETTVSESSIHQQPTN